MRQQVPADRDRARRVQDPAAVRPVRENGASARSRAANDPVVQRMAEKFGAEIRTVIDHREKN